MRRLPAAVCALPSASLRPPATGRGPPRQDPADRTRARPRPTLGRGPAGAWAQPAPVGRSLFDFLVAGGPAASGSRALPVRGARGARRGAARRRERPSPEARPHSPRPLPAARRRAPETFFRFPRASRWPWTPSAGPARTLGLLLKDRLYVGYQETARRPRGHQLQRGRRPLRVPGGARTTAREATPAGRLREPRALHGLPPERGPVFARPLWDETNANAGIGGLLRRGAGATSTASRIEPGVDVAYDIDTATDRANLLLGLAAPLERGLRRGRGGARVSGLAAHGRPPLRPDRWGAGAAVRVGHGPAGELEAAVAARPRRANPRPPEPEPARAGAAAGFEGVRPAGPPSRSGAGGARAAHTGSRGARAAAPARAHGGLDLRTGRAPPGAARARARCLSVSRRPARTRRSPGHVHAGHDDGTARGAVHDFDQRDGGRPAARRPRLRWPHRRGRPGSGPRGPALRRKRRGGGARGSGELEPADHGRPARLEPSRSTGGPPSAPGRRVESRPRTRAARLSPQAAEDGRGPYHPPRPRVARWRPGGEGREGAWTPGARSRGRLRGGAPRGVVPLGGRARIGQGRSPGRRPLSARPADGRLGDRAGSRGPASLLRRRGAPAAGRSRRPPDGSTGRPAGRGAERTLRPLLPVLRRLPRHRRPFTPNFLHGTPAEVAARLEECAPRIAFRLSMWTREAGDRGKTPMPPASALPAFGVAPSEWPGHGDLAALRRLASEVLGTAAPRGEAPSGPPYEALPPCPSR